MRIIKRNGKNVAFDAGKITTAVEKAMEATPGGIDSQLAAKIARDIEASFGANDLPGTIDEIQDAVESALMTSSRQDAAKAYILYRFLKDRERKVVADEGKAGLLPADFISKMKHAKNPMGNFGSLVYYRSYSRYLPEMGRREYWSETVRRAVEYNCSLAPTGQKEAKELYENMFYLKQFLSGRTLWAGGTDMVKDHPTANFNCAAVVIDGYEAYAELFYLLMVGSGVGIRVLKEDIAKLPVLRGNVDVIHKAYEPKEKNMRAEYSSITFTGVKDSNALITVGDSKEGWMQAIEYFFKLLYSFEYKGVNTIVIDYNNVRAKGEKLTKFGGTASGHESIKTMFEKIQQVIKARRNESGIAKLRPIDALDIANIIGENVVSGGVRRTAEIGLIDADDSAIMDGKSDLFINDDGNWVINKDIAHRALSNNSIFYKEKPSRKAWHDHLDKMRYSGEPGFINAEAAGKRRENFNMCNPCAEILLDNRGMCNLTTVNVYAFVDENGKLDETGLLRAQELSARAGYRMTQVELELPKWNETQRRDRLIGCSLTGWQDMVNATDMSLEKQKKLLSKLKTAAVNAANKYARELGSGEPVLKTTVKPEGTLSCLPAVSSGVHFSHAPYFLRRVRISATDPLLKVCEELGWPTFPEIGQDEDSCSTKYVEFPLAAPKGAVKKDVSAIEQLNIYKMFMEHYVEHNASITVHVKDDEWAVVEEWVYKNWDTCVAISFLSYSDSFYEAMPFEEITKEEFEKRAAAMKPFAPSLISKYEKNESVLDVGADTECVNGACPIH